MAEKYMCIYILLLQYCILHQVSGRFQIEQRSPSNPETGESIYIKSGGILKLSCTSNEEFNLCQWIRPDSISCGILNSDQTTTCKEDPRVSGMSSWKIEKEGNRKCILTVESVRHTEIGDWHCRLESLPNNGARKSYKTELFPIKLLEPSKVTIHGSNELTLRSGAEETVVCSAKGSPKAVKLEWYLDDNPLKILRTEIDDSQETDVIKQTVTAVFPQNSDRLECKAIQIDAMNNEIASRDWRTVRVVSNTRRAAPLNLGRKSGQFTVEDHYPKPNNGEQSGSILLKQGIATKFYCRSSLPWNVCQWLRPGSGDKPCQTFANPGSTSCDSVWRPTNVIPEYDTGGQDKDSYAKESHWTIDVVDEYTCSISTHAIAASDIGQWNCDLQSFPFSDKTYHEDQKYFTVDLIRPAMIQFDNYPDEFELVEGDQEEFKITIQNANPIPTIDWYVGSHKLEGDEIKILHDGTPRDARSSGESFYQTILYTAQTGHNGQQLSCVVRQTDEEDHELEQNFPVTTLFVSAPIVDPPTAPLGVGVIAVIVSIACFILLALILLFIAFRTGRFCFKNATHTVLVKEVEAPRPDQNSMETQANMSAGVECGVGADFGPTKPIRTYSRENLANDSGETVPLIANEKAQGKSIAIVATNTEKAAGDDDTNDQARRLEAMLSADELKEYEFEGNDSICTSLSSLDTNVPEEDWEATFRALGPKFHRLADIVGSGRSDESGSDDENETRVNKIPVKYGNQINSSTLASFHQKVSHSVSSSRKYIKTVNIKQTSSIQHYSQDSQNTDSGLSNTESSAVNGGDEDSTDGTEI